MRTAALIFAASGAVFLSACNKPAEDVPEGMTEAAEASGVAVDATAPTSPPAEAPAR